MGPPHDFKQSAGKRNLPRKSDQGGIEIFVKELEEQGLLRRKSDQGGIEIRRKEERCVCVFGRKSDQGGIEIN